MRIDIGTLLRGIDAAASQLSPDMLLHLDSLYGRLERAADVSVRNDVFTLGGVTAHSFSIGLPAGGLFADEIVLVEQASIEPISKLLEKPAAKLCAKPRTIGPAGAVTCLNLADGVLVESLRRAISVSGTPGEK